MSTVFETALGFLLFTSCKDQLRWVFLAAKSASALRWDYSDHYYVVRWEAAMVTRFDVINQRRWGAPLKYEEVRGTRREVFT